MLAEHDTLGECEHELDELRDQHARALYWSIREAVEREGMDPVAASRAGLKAARQVVLREIGFEQREILRVLSVSKRQASDDAARVREALKNGSAVDASGRLPPVPVPEGERLRV